MKKKENLFKKKKKKRVIQRGEEKKRETEEGQLSLVERQMEVDGKDQTRLNQGLVKGSRDRLRRNTKVKKRMATNYGGMKSRAQTSWQPGVELASSFHRLFVFLLISCYFSARYSSDKKSSLTFEKKRDSILV